MPGNVSLDSMLAEIGKLRAVRAVGLPAGLFADVAPQVVAGWRARATVESPSHLRAHPNTAKTLTLLAALLHARQREITDTLVDLLISTVHRINARAEKKVTEELVNAFKQVTGKENILFPIARGVRWPRRTTRCGRWCTRRCPAASRRCASWCTSTRPRARCTGRTVADHAARLLHRPLPARPDPAAGRAGVPVERTPPTGR